MTGTGQRVSNIGDISEAHYTLAAIHEDGGKMKVARAFPFLFIAFLCGCGTLLTQLPYAKEEMEKDKNTTGAKLSCFPQIYSGTVFDVIAVKETFGNLTDNIGALLILDIPFSLIADTVVLPITIYEQIRYGNICAPGLK